MSASEKLVEFVSLIVVSIIIFAVNPSISSELSYAEKSAFGPAKNLLYLLQIIFSLHLDIIFIWITWVSSLKFRG